MNQLEKAWSKYPFGHYAHYYYRGFQEPIGESFLSQWGDKNARYTQITKQQKRDIEKGIPNYDEFSGILEEFIERIKELVDNIISSNTIISSRMFL